MKIAKANWSSNVFNFSHGFLRSSVTFNLMSSQTSTESYCFWTSGSRYEAFIEADCTAERNWVDEILKAHRFPDLAVGGAIANGNPDNYNGWAAYFCKFSQWMPKRPNAWSTDEASANMMKCPKCHSENPDTKQFCGDCGTQLPKSEEISPSITKTLESPREELTTGSIFAGRYLSP